MKEYQATEIRNVSIIGSAGAGKTSLAESILLAGGVIDRKGTVENKNTVSDYRTIEHERENSIKATVLYSEFNNHKINFIDNPGFDDFIGEVILSMYITEVSTLVLNGNAGIDVGSEIAWRNAKNYNQPVILVANQLDHEKTDYDELIRKGKEFFGKKVIPIQYPVETGENFNTIIDVLKMKLYKYPVGGGKPEVHDIPDDHKERAEEMQNELIEAAAENDDSLMELFFDKGTLDEDEMRKGISIGLMNRDLFPLMCVSAKQNIGIYRLLEFITKVVPAPVDGQTILSEDDKEIPYDAGKLASAFVFKTSLEEHLGEVSFFKVITGEITEAMDLECLQTSTKEKLSQLYVMAGKKREKVVKLVSGDIGATIKLKNTKTNHTLAIKGSETKYKAIKFPQPKFRTAVKAINSSDDEKLASSLLRMNVEDHTLIFEYSKELKQMLIHGQGELHINIARWHLETEQKVLIEFIAPKIPYRETITKEAKADYRHKKQSGGSGQFGEVYIMIEPYEEGKPDPEKKLYNIRGKEEHIMPWGGMLVYYNAIVGGAIDVRYLPAILKGILEKMETGPLTGSYARDIRVIVYDGKMHPVDSNEISFKLAGRHAFSEAFKNAGPKLMEPVYFIDVVVPEDRMGDVMTDLQGRRAIILGMDGQGIYQRIKANVPLAEMNKYSTALSSLTNGRASYTMDFKGYEQVPGELQDKLLKEYEASLKEED